MKIHGCMVHCVVSAMDEGPILCRAAVSVLDSDTSESLPRRVLAQEHALYTAALARVTRGGLVIQGNRVYDPEPGPEVAALGVPPPPVQ